jgi:hypothetical protein
VDSACTDRRLPLEAQLRLRQIELQAEQLDIEQLRECLIAAWGGWLLERHQVRRSLEYAGIDLAIKATGYTPFEVCQIDG